MEEEPRGSRLPPEMSTISSRSPCVPQKRKREMSGKAGSASQQPKCKKKKNMKGTRKAPRKAAPHYFVHETDNDMLLIISNVGEVRERKVIKKKRKQQQQQQRWPKGPKKKKTLVSRGRRKQAARDASADQQVASGVLDEDSQSLLSETKTAPGGSWGEHLPIEVLVQIFQFVAVSEGAVPFLCRVACVCRLWYGAASNPVLWQNVSIGCCWEVPGKKISPALEKRVLSTMEWLAANRFSHLREFALCHWKSHVPFVLKAISGSCPLLASLKLSHCSGVTSGALSTLAQSCLQLRSLNLQNSQMDASAGLRFLEAAGPRIQHLWLTYSSRMSAIIAELAGGRCPSLQLLEVNTEIKQSTQHFQLPIEQLQAACPQLQVLRLLNVTCYAKPTPFSASLGLGFPQLEELCLATTSFSFVDNSMLQRILCTSSQLRVLDLRGCFRVTPKVLELLPCPDLEHLYLDLSYSISHLPLPLEGSPLITQKWSHSLRVLDLAGQSFSEQDLDQAMGAFNQGAGGEPPLRSLNLTGTKITLQTVSTLIASCPWLSYLNLSSCRHMPRGMKKAYRGHSEVRQCLHQLLGSLEEVRI